MFNLIAWFKRRHNEYISTNILAEKNQRNPLSAGHLECE